MTFIRRLASLAALALAASAPAHAAGPSSDQGGAEPLPAHRPSPYRVIDYQVEFNGAPVAVTTLWRNQAGDPCTKLTVHYAAVETAGPGRFLVRAGEPVRSFTVFPRPAGLVAQQHGKALAIEAAAPAQFMVRINDGEPLFIWVSARAPDTPSASDPRVVDAGRFDLDHTGTTEATAGLQRAIDEAAKLGAGATVLVPPGTYRTGSLWMRSGVTLWLSAGAVLAASPDDTGFPRTDYAPRSTEHPATNPRAQAAMLWFDGVRDAALCGSGVIDGDGYARFQREPFDGRLRMNQIRVVNSENIRIEGPVLRDAVFWSVHLLRSRNVTVRDLKIVNEMPLAGWNPTNPASIWNNADGINPDACQNVLIEDIFIHAGDDAIALKTTNSGPDLPPDLDNVVCRRAVLASSTAAVKFGTESIARGFRNVVFEDLDILPIHRGRGLGFSMQDRAHVENIVFRRVRFSAPLRWLDLKGGKRSPEQPELSRLNQVLFDDIDIPAGSTCVLRPPYPLAELPGLRFRGLRYGGEPVTKPDLLRFEQTGGVPDIRIEPAANEPIASDSRPRPRLLVTTDIGGDPDDQQAMIRLLVHANEFDIEGLIASSAGVPGQLAVSVTKPQLIHQLIDAYAEVQPNLARHAAGFPLPAQLRNLVRSGNPQRGEAAIGPGHDTPASAWIIRCIERADPRPLNIVIWGGQTDFAQALWRLREDRGETAARALRARLRVYDICDQDGLRGWLREHFPDLFYVLTRQPAGRDKREAAVRGTYLGGDESLTSRAWIDANVRVDRGPLGALYPTKTWTAPNPHGALKEGDTPSWFYFLPFGPGDAAHPDWGGWGGRFAPAEDGCGWRDAQDTVAGETSARATVWRWRPVFQNEFAARMQWAVTSDPAAANHPPRPLLVGDDITKPAFEHTVQAGTRLRLDAGASRDPDGDRLRPRWWHYPEAGTWRGDVVLEAADTLTPTVLVPADASGTTIHLVFELQDSGSPALTRYRRVILHMPR